MDKLACFYIWHVKQLQIKQGDLDKKKSCSCWKGMIHDLLLTYVKTKAFIKPKRLFFILFENKSCIL